jgi:hypothetical protein
MNIVNLYKKVKQILNDSNVALVNKGLNSVDNLCSIPSELSRISINRLPYALSKQIIEVTADDLIGVTTIGNNAFYHCTSLQSVTIPDSVTSIGDNAFYHCTSLQSVTIPDGVTSIGGSAFYNTAYYNNGSNWENNVLYIDNYLIKAKTSLSGSYTIKDGTRAIADNAFSGCTNLTSITIPDSVTSIGDYAFSGCTNLTSITIPDSVTSIGDWAFDSCSSLTDMYLESITPPSLGNTYAIPTIATIHVLIGSGDAYKSATNWSYYSNRIVEDIQPS